MCYVSFPLGSSMNESFINYKRAIQGTKKCNLNLCIKIISSLNVIVFLCLQTVQKMQGGIATKAFLLFLPMKEPCSLMPLLQATGITLYPHQRQNQIPQNSYYRTKDKDMINIFFLLAAKRTHVGQSFLFFEDDPKLRPYPMSLPKQRSPPQMVHKDSKKGGKGRGEYQYSHTEKVPSLDSFSTRELCGG